MRLIEMIIERLGAERRIQALGRELKGLSASELLARGVGKSDVLRLARLAVHHPMAELRRMAREDGAAEVERGPLAWLLGNAMALRAA
jgi:hypothetical protein